MIIGIDVAKDELVVATGSRGERHASGGEAKLQLCRRVLCLTGEP